MADASFCRLKFMATWSWMSWVQGIRLLSRTPWGRRFWGFGVQAFLGCFRNLTGSNVARKATLWLWDLGVFENGGTLLGVSLQGHSIRFGVQEGYPYFGRCPPRCRRI